MEKDNERKQIAKIICNVINKTTCKKCDYRCIAYEIADTLAADFVPKSECDKWYAEYHKVKEDLKRERMYQRESAQLADKYFAELQTVRTEVAKQVFEAIEIAWNTTYYEKEFEERLDELRKKYVGD